MTWILVAGAFYLFGPWVLLALSLSATAVHGGQELVGWWGKRAWWLFLVAQASFVALAVGGLIGDYPALIWLLVAARLADGIGFHAVFFPQWPGRDTLVLPLADGALLTLYMIA